jgi:dihydroorotate dehydrogenase
MSVLEKIGLPLLRKLDPETAHGLSIKALQRGLAPTPGVVKSPRLQTSVAGLSLANPVGLAAGYDKNAEALAPLMQSGFGFLEVGAATPEPQMGNPKPRLFRLTEDRAAINRFGFNNQGAEAIASRLRARPNGVPVGLNLGANKTSDDKSADFAKVLTVCGDHCDFATVNVSSPNTEKLRDLQGKDALGALLTEVITTRDAMDAPIPIFLKIAPDLSDVELFEIATAALTTGVDAIIATNTTLDRDGLKGPHKKQSGGLSGAPLFEKSTRVLAQLSEATEGVIPLIGVGGIASGQDAFDKIAAGASAVQVYTAMVYEGLSVIPTIAKDLDRILKDKGFDTVTDAVGTNREKWL